MIRYRLLITFWLLSDILLFIAAYALAYFLRVGFLFSTDFPFDKYIYIVLLASAFWILLLLITRSFALTRKQTSLKNFVYMAYASFTSAALFSIGYYFIYGLFFSRLLLAMSICISMIFGWIWHIIYSIIFRSMLRKNPPTFPTLILGVTRESEQLIKLLTDQKNPLTPVAVLDGKGVKFDDINGVPVLGKLNKLEEVLEKYKITHLIQCSDLEQTINLLSACRKHGITYMLLPSVLGIVERDERVEKLEGQSVVCVDNTSGLNWFFR